MSRNVLRVCSHNFLNVLKFRDSVVPGTRYVVMRIKATYAAVPRFCTTPLCEENVWCYDE